MSPQQKSRRRDLFLSVQRNEDHQTWSCDHCQKISYRSRSKARKVMADRFPGEAMNAYSCPQGDGFHIGHLSRAIRTGATSRQAKYGVTR